MTELEKQFEKIEKAFEKHAYDDLRHFAELADTLKRIEQKVDGQMLVLEPIAKAYNGILFSRQFLLGLSGVVIAIGAIGGGMYWLVNALVHKGP